MSLHHPSVPALWFDLIELVLTQSQLLFSISWLCFVCACFFLKLNSKIALINCHIVNCVRFLPQCLTVRFRLLTEDFTSNSHIEKRP